MDNNTVFDGSKALLGYLIEAFPKRVDSQGADLNYGWRVRDKVFRNTTFRGKYSMVFKGCKFIDCRFENVSGFFCLFENCKFNSTTFIDSRFSHIEDHWDNNEFNKCWFKGVQLDEGWIRNAFFNECSFEMFYANGIFFMENVWFTNCNLQEVQFQGINYYHENDQVDEEYPDIAFVDSTLDLTGFSNVDFRNSQFFNCILASVSFFDCRLAKDSFVKSKELKYESKASADFQTFLKSDDLPRQILADYFNIHDTSIKKTIAAMTTKTEYQKLFISFSFKDKRFAKRLDDEFTKRGIRTFFWVKDAPPGETLKDIMRSGVRANDRIIFIASANSIRSEACQFELSEGRRKQAELWENIIFPVHIDDYLFTVQKDQIRPVDKMEEYWLNIEEIRRINSADFTNFNKDRVNKVAFADAVDKIVAQLKNINNN